MTFGEFFNHYIATKKNTVEESVKQNFWNKIKIKTSHYN